MYLKERLSRELTTEMVMYIINKHEFKKDCKKSALADRTIIIKKAANKMNVADFKLCTIECLKLTAEGAELRNVSPCTKDLTKRFELCLETIFDEVYKNVFND